MRHPWIQLLRFKKKQLKGPCFAHILALKCPCFGYYYCNFASTCLILFKFSLKHYAGAVNLYPSIVYGWDYIVAMFPP